MTKRIRSNARYVDSGARRSITSTSTCSGVCTSIRTTTTAPLTSARATSQRPRRTTTARASRFPAPGVARTAPNRACSHDNRVKSELCRFCYHDNRTRCFLVINFFFVTQSIACLRNCKRIVRLLLFVARQRARR